MFPTRILMRLSLVLLAFTCMVGLSGCGAADQGAPDDTTRSTELVGEEFNPGPDHLVENWPSEGGGSVPPPLPKLSVVPFAADTPTPDDRNTNSLGAGEAASPGSPITSIPKMAVRSGEIDTLSPAATPRLAAPLSMAPANDPELAARVDAERTLAPTPATRMMAAPAGDTAPRMAEMTLEPNVREMSPEPLAMEMAASSEPADETSAVARTPVAEDRGNYKAVTVFYGTDRSSNATSGQPDQPHRLWLYGAGVCVLLFGLFALVAMSSKRKKTFASLAVMSFSAGSVMAVMGTIAWLQRDGAVAGPKREYGNGRGSFVMGTCEVSIPANHQVAELEAPSVFRLDFVENPTKHVVLLDIEEQDSETFFSQLRKRVDQGVSKDAFVFVHGFNVTFEDAARRTAQLAYDLNFQGAPIFYSWPSQGGLFQYAVDETNVVWTVPHLQQFLKEIADQSGARSVHLVAHSMGNRALTSALRELSLELRGTPPLFNEVVLTAPDIDAEIFRRDIAPAIITTAKRVTLYASSNDEALVLSKQVHGYPRAGETGDGLVVIPGIETVDVSAVDTSLLGHNYYGDNATVISDMIDLVRNSKSARERSWLETARLDNLFYWVFRADRAAVGAASTDARPRY